MSSWINRFGLLAVSCLLALQLSGCADKGASQPEPFIATDITGSGYGGNFRLADHNGTIRTQADFKGKVVLLVFGYTHCPDVCLTLLSELALVQRQLGEDAARVQVLFVTLDPARDTPEKLASYVTYFNQGFLALSGDEAEIAKAAGEFRVSYSKHDVGSAAGYLLDHSAGIYGIDMHGRLRLLINYGSEPAAIVHDVKLLLSEKP